MPPSSPQKNPRQRVRTDNLTPDDSRQAEPRKKARTLCNQKRARGTHPLGPPKQQNTQAQTDNSELAHGEQHSGEKNNRGRIYSFVFQQFP